MVASRSVWICLRVSRRLRYGAPTLRLLLSILQHALACWRTLYRLFSLRYRTELPLVAWSAFAMDAKDGGAVAV